MLSHLLVGYDGSESAKHAFQFAVELARLCQARIRVVSVLQVSEGGADACALLMAETNNERLEEIRSELAALAPAAMECIEIVVLHGSPGDLILEQVRQYDIDHIVLGHTERGALARWLVGSVSADMLARAHLPVTIVP